VLGDKAEPGITANSHDGGRPRLGRHGRIRHTCRSVGDGERGFVYVSASTATLHKDPSANSPIIATAPHGGRLLFRDTRRKDGIGWYYFNSAGRTGWVPLGEVSCNRPEPLPPGKPLPLEDIDLGKVHPAIALGGARG